ncbi:secreted frizzled-related protein 5-like isoform X1 [Mytilus trossulus]|uniref:secreted frizzled-related protein 5-like isoform X1 n=1 Tax=Mytilus trossulus TaxID=6551 RepID=UPI003004A255
MRFLSVLCAFVSVQASFYDYKYGDGYVSDGEKPTAWQGTLLSGRMSQPKCIDIPKNLTLCQNIGYDQMRLPNLLDHDSINEVIQQSRSWISLLGVHCHPDTKLFLCSLFSPVCLERDREIYPCRSLCESVRDGCETIMKAYSYKWPDMVRCDKFPDDTEMCIPGQSTVMPTSRYNKPQNMCSSCNQINTFESLIHNYCRSTVVIKVKLKKASMRKGNLVVYIKKKKKMIKGNLSKKEKRKLTPIIEDGASCDCEYLSANSTSKKSFIIMGNMTDEGELSLVFMSTWERNKGFRRAIRMMKRGVSCDSDIIAISDGSKTDNSSGGGKTKGKDKKKGKGRKRKNKGRKNKKNKKKGKKNKNKKSKKDNNVANP